MREDEYPDDDWQGKDEPVRVYCYTCGRWVHVIYAEYDAMNQYWMCDDCLAEEREAEKQHGEGGA